MSKAGGRRKDEYWKHVTEKDGKWSCNYCTQVFSGKISVTRIKAHLKKEKGKGISTCSFDRDNEGVHNNMAFGSNNPQEPVVSIHGGARSDLGVHGLQGQALTTELTPYGHISGSINLPEVAEDVLETMHANISSSIDHQNIVDYGGMSIGMDGSSYNKNAFEREITHLNQLVSDLKSEKGYIEEHVQWLQCRGKKRKRHVDDWLDELEELIERADDMNNFVDPQPDNNYRLEIADLIAELQEHKENMPLVLSTEFVGANFVENIRKMWELVADEQVFIIGVYGMGGVGKTLLATHVENEIKRKRTFKDVFWVTVSQNYSISKLQRDIAKRMGVKLDEDDERVRAANLSLALEAKGKSVLILDDVWKYIDLQKVGIPNGIIKVIVTTRLKHVCQQMDCLPNNMIQMLPLRSCEAEELFNLKLGHNGTPATLPPEIEKIACSVVDRCDGLPLAISVIARSMKGIYDIYWWKHARNKLEELEMGDEVEEEVFKVLKRSYDNLMDKCMQNCFLYCALLGGLQRDELIMKLVDNGLINGRRSLEEIFDEGNTVLDKLEAHSLLMERDEEGFVCIHRLVTEMAYHILKESRRCAMMRFEEGFTKEWTTDLELVNLIPANIEEIPEGTSPPCPRLSTLLLGAYPYEYGNWNHICHIPECFFQNMNALTVLHLSQIDGLESLPSSVSELRSLVSLVIINCGTLQYVPPLGELQALSRLVISCCLIQQVPQGLEKLIHLKWLDLSSNDGLTFVPGSVLPILTNLQYLDLRGCLDVKIKVEDVQGMKMLECFGGSFLDCEHYSHYVQNILDKYLGPKTYHLLIGNCCSDFWSLKSILPNDPKTITIVFEDCEDFSIPHILPKDLTDLSICCNEQWICLCGALSFNASSSSSLRRIEVEDCEQLKGMFCLFSSCSFCTNIHNLESLRLKRLGSLTIFCKDVADVRQSVPPGVMFSYLKVFHISDCPLIEKLLTTRLILHLPNLETMTVRSCNSMKEIFAVDDGDGSSIMLPKLTTLELWNLPQLNTVFKGIISCGSQPKLDICDCPNLKWDETNQIKSSQ